MKIVEIAPIDVSVTRSPDNGALVVQIDTGEDTGHVQVAMNDSIIFDRDPEEPHPLQDLLREYDSVMGEFNTLSPQAQVNSWETHCGALIKLVDKFAHQIRVELNR